MSDEAKGPPIQPPIIERCSCGHDRNHHMVSERREYTAWGKFWMILMGVSSRPIKIDFVCRHCKERFDFIKDEKELNQYL
mgnify:CR=1 FL=1